MQLLVSTHVEQAYLGTAPTLGEVKTCYGEATAIAWMCAMLEDLNDFVGARQKMELPQQISLSKLVLAVYHYLKVTELQLFFHRLKCGRYGRFFGSVDTLFLTESLLAFIHERGQELHHFVTERREQEQEASRQQAGPCVTYQEYLELKRLKNETT